jgi:RNA ligase (TIGR02306 family)
VKWEAPPEFTSADARGSFPDFIFKTDQERVQNCYDDVSKYFSTQTFEVSEKMEGSSITMYFKDGEYGVCSRNLNLKRSDDNTFWKTAASYDLESKMTALGKNIGIQGELIGTGVQGNIYNLSKHMIMVFDIFDIDNQCYFTPNERRELTKQLGLTDVPILETVSILESWTLDKFLDRADGQSVVGVLGCLREGLVFKANNPLRISFKAVSNQYLFKHDN